MVFSCIPSPTEVRHKCLFSCGRHIFVLLTQWHFIGQHYLSGLTRLLLLPEVGQLNCLIKISSDDYKVPRLSQEILSTLWQTIPTDFSPFTLFDETLPLSLLPIRISCILQVAYFKPTAPGTHSLTDSIPKQTHILDDSNPRYLSQWQGMPGMWLSTPMSALEKQKMGAESKRITHHKVKLPGSSP